MSNWTTGTQMWSNMMGTVGRYSIQAQVRFSSFQTMSYCYKPTTVLEYEVKPPDRAEPITMPVSPLNNPKPISNPPSGMPNLTVQFEVRGNGRKLFISPQVSEKIIRTKYGRTPDMDWGPGDFLSINNGVISDMKGVMMTNAQWAGVNEGDTIDEFDQQFAVKLQDSFGLMVTYPLEPVYHFRMSKTGNNWQLTQPMP